MVEPLLGVRFATRKSSHDYHTLKPNGFPELILSTNSSPSLHDVREFYNDVPTYELSNHFIDPYHHQFLDYFN